MKFLSAVVGVLLYSSSIPVQAMYSPAQSNTIQPVPVQDYNLTFTCGTTLYTNGPIGRTLGRVYKTRRESKPYPMEFNAIQYRVSTTVYIFPLLPSFRLYSDEKNPEHFLVFNDDKLILGGVYLMETSEGRVFRPCYFPMKTQFLTT
ncbi:CSEP0132 putative effector protein [Blumeria hordei DH14]|uniref:CSEP0132 putative effector protein n=1 Tax=Blumeria graminis f. sp. hordei (strain DH14) TaxID=546991 RepID=N1JFG6_BLUG1|nr:CSEP0132 putative effector protein [Blumeria hordei DH14]